MYTSVALFIFMRCSTKCKEIGNMIHYFGKFLLIFELGRGQYSAPNLAGMDAHIDLNLCFMHMATITLG